MGIFDRFKKNTARQEEEPQDALLEIIRIVSFQDTEILESVRDCVENTADFFQRHRDDYEDRGIAMEDETSLLQWIGCVDLLLAGGFVCECDWNGEKDDFVAGISPLKGISSLSLPVDAAWFDEGQGILQWCNTLDEKWKSFHCAVAAFDIDSDSYVMFPCKKGDMEQLSDLAKHFGYRIDYAKNM